MKIGVLALQGAVAEHVRLLEKAGSQALTIKKVHQLEEVDGLVIPGGESTTISKLMHKYGFDTAVKRFAEEKPVFGTCAGLILLAKRIEGQDAGHLGLMDINVRRNAFGRQRESFEYDLPVTGVAEDFRAVFIRAPYILEAGEGVDVLATFDEKIVAARQGRFLCSAFHPELTDDDRMHRYFAEMVREAKAAQKV